MCIQQIVIGCILGDGYLTKSGCLQIEHSIKQKEYIYWKYKKLKTIVRSEPVQVSRYDKRTDRTYFSYRFYTKAIFKDLRFLFYPTGKKIIPYNIEKILISNLALAILYMDDGGKGGNTKKGVIINIAGYDLQSRKRLQLAILKIYNIKLNLHKNGQLYIPAKSYNQFYQCIYHFIIPCMQYKLSITP